MELLGKYAWIIAITIGLAVVFVDLSSLTKIIGGVIALIFGIYALVNVTREEKE